MERLIMRVLVLAIESAEKKQKKGSNSSAFFEAIVQKTSTRKIYVNRT